MVLVMDARTRSRSSKVEASDRRLSSHHAQLTTLTCSLQTGLHTELSGQMLSCRLVMRGVRYLFSIFNTCISEHKSAAVQLSTGGTI